ncbi:hypothetical protein [Gracilimonas mengyeensis]|uniref:Uncharacterized protein n=1 Tax=Gracilimonas mengyeensis TaxID=1302730 RepID=A0A521BS64_9BACT|nr:hypothetical protein [Gracilimonas mengyeensis]SMO49949.1 hypothetical protein SAMN06265219_10330 [Gracilimonas mengyeensis]
MPITPTSKTKSRATNLIRISVLLLILPVLYLALWYPISTDETLTYFEKVTKLMGYFPEKLRHPYWITVTFCGLSLSSAIFGFNSYLKFETRQGQIIAIIISAVAVFLTAIFGMMVIR